jgi:hypothetical protein
MKTVLLRVCTICEVNNRLIMATHVATNAEGLQWYECEKHDDMDHNTAFGLGKRTQKESADEFFKRHFPEKAG